MESLRQSRRQYLGLTNPISACLLRPQAHIQTVLVETNSDSKLWMTIPDSDGVLLLKTRMKWWTSTGFQSLCGISIQEQSWQEHDPATCFLQRRMVPGSI
jgi:hypothetical protein